MKKYNAEFKSMIVELYQTGRSVKELSREYGVSEVTIYKWIKQISPIASIDDTDITLEEIKRIEVLSKMGYSMRQIAQQLKCYYSMIDRELKLNTQRTYQAL